MLRCRPAQDPFVSKAMTDAAHTSARNAANECDISGDPKEI